MCVYVCVYIYIHTYVCIHIHVYIYTPTGVLCHKNSRLFALWEGGRPHELDPISLETLGETTLDGVIGTWMMDSFSAHFRRVVS